MTTPSAPRPGPIGRIRSRQSGLPTGPLGRIIGRAMESSTSVANDLALELLDLGHPRTVLEVGFGQGRTVAQLARRGHRVLGVDPSPTMVRQATARNRAACRDGRVNLRRGDGIVIPFPDHSADVGLTVHTIYFMSDPDATLADIGRVLRPGGRLALACRTLDDPMRAWMDPAVYRIPTAAHVETMLAQAGLTAIEHRMVDRDDHQLHLFCASTPTSGGRS